MFGSLKLSSQLELGVGKVRRHAQQLGNDQLCCKAFTRVGSPASVASWVSEWQKHMSASSRGCQERGRQAGRQPFSGMISTHLSKMACEDCVLRIRKYARRASSYG